MQNEANKARIERLRERAVEPAVSYNQFHLYFFRHLTSNDESLPLEQCYGEAFYHAFSHIALSIEEDELIVGRSVPPTETELREWEILREQTAPYMAFCGQDSHMAVDYALVLREGLSGIQKRIAGKLEKETDEDRRRFYESCAACLKAVIHYSARYAAYAAQLAAQTADPVRREELLQIARICERVPREPARDFYEAVQAVHMVALSLSFDPLRWFAFEQFQLGHPDRYLLPYYEQGLCDGTLTPEKAQLLLDCLGIQINRRVPHGLSCGYMVGGRDRSGRLVANELTTLCMRVVEDIRLVYPSVGLCYTSEMPDCYLQQACEILAQGRSHPAIFNDDIITQGLMEYGMPEDEAHCYIHSTCVEITPDSSSNVWVASPYISLVQPLFSVMEREYPDMDAFCAAYCAELNTTIAREFEVQNNFRRERAARSMNPLLSCLVNDCLERGLDIEKGGARYNWIMPSFIGMANRADALTAIRTLVFEEKRLSMADFKAMLDCDYEGYEAQRQEILHRIPKYGNDNDEVDGWCDWITTHIARECRKYTPRFSEGRWIPSVFCWIMHAQMGAETGATPDGRKAGFPLGDGSGPAQGRERNGPTASLLSSTKWSHKEFVGGVAVNLKFSKRVFCADSCCAMLALIKTYMQRGGFEVQINVVDRETLLDARRNPEQHRDLVVRIGGYSDYFVRLPEKMQEEVLQRTEHTL